MSAPELVSTDPSLYPILPGSTYNDSYLVRVARAVDAREAAEAALATPPGWMRFLLSTRDLMVKPFGLKAAGRGAHHAEDRVGSFPVVSETPDRIVLGFNDKHLDFRIVIDCRPSGQATWVSATTLVKTHNWLGRSYLMLILPFHRAIVKSTLLAI